jgi:hypothetical protein
MSADGLLAAETAASVHNDRIIDIHLAVNDRWCAFDLDELLEAIEFAGLPGELIATYQDASGRRRYVERRRPRTRSNIR